MNVEKFDEAVKSFSFIRSNLEYHYGTTDGSMHFPNSADGDLLKHVYKTIKNLEESLDDMD